MDCTYLRDPPELQIFLCAEESEDPDGGSSTFVDGLKVAERMYAQSPEAFRFFASTRLGFQCIQDGVHSVAYGKNKRVVLKSQYIRPYWKTCTHYW